VKRGGQEGVAKDQREDGLTGWAASAAEGAAYVRRAQSRSSRTSGDAVSTVGCRPDRRRPPAAPVLPRRSGNGGMPGVVASRWMFKYVSPACSALYTPLDAAMIFPVNKIPISTVIEGRGAQEMVSVGAASKKSVRFAHCTLITGGNRRWTC
jgi:hypothetical protein